MMAGRTTLRPPEQLEQPARRRPLATAYVPRRVRGRSWGHNGVCRARRPTVCRRTITEDAAAAPRLLTMPFVSYRRSQRRLLVDPRYLSSKPEAESTSSRAQGQPVIFRPGSSLEARMEHGAGEGSCPCSQPIAGRSRGSAGFSQRPAAA